MNRGSRLGRFLRVFGSRPLTAWNDKRWSELSINPRPSQATAAVRQELTAEVKGLVATLVWFILAIVPWAFHERLTEMSSTWTTVGLQLLLPLVLMPLVYYKTQFVFFDVLIKRGVLAFVLLASSVAWFAALVQLPVAGLAQATAVWAGAVAFTVFWTWFYRALNAIMDHYLFRRPDYPKLLEEIGRELTGFVESGALVSHAGEKLRDALSASFVRFQEGPADSAHADAAASVRIANADCTWGWFHFGPPRKGQPYRSEDLQFLETIAPQVAAMLDNFSRQRELEEQRHREAQLRELAARSELKALRAQINPHVLFNALNTLADLTHVNPKLAETLVVALAEVFRFALDATRRDEVRLGDEIAFLESYLRIEEARFGAKLRYTIDVARAPARIPGAAHADSAAGGERHPARHFPAPGRRNRRHTGQPRGGHVGDRGGGRWSRLRCRTPAGGAGRRWAGQRPRPCRAPRRARPLARTFRPGRRRFRGLRDRRENRREGLCGYCWLTTKRPRATGCGACSPISAGWKWPARRKTEWKRWSGWRRCSRT